MMLRSAEPVRQGDRRRSKGVRSAASGFDPAHPPKIRASAPAADAVQATLNEASYWLSAIAPLAFEGQPEGVHRLRTTTRRVRTALRLFGGLTDPEWADRLAGEFKWLGERLGEVRDLDVLTARLRSHAEEIESDPAGPLSPLFDDLHARHEATSEALRAALRGARFETMAAELSAAAENLTLRAAARHPCRRVLPRLVATAWKRLEHNARALDSAAADEAFHEVRKRAKRARYAAEAVAAALDHSSHRAALEFARRARDVQDVLGTHQDAVVAAGEIRHAAADRPDAGPFNFAAGRLLEVETRLAAESRDRFFEVWAELDQKKLVRWLKP
jgi:CHAD domain-containing protein